MHGWETRMLLPDLDLPMERVYTQTGFGGHAPPFQEHHAECLRLAQEALAAVARLVNASECVGIYGCHSSVTRVLASGLIGLDCAGRDGSAQ